MTKQAGWLAFVPLVAISVSAGCTSTGPLRLYPADLGFGWIVLKGPSEGATACGAAVTTGRIRAYLGRVLLWEITNGCGSTAAQRVEIKGVSYTDGKCGSGNAADRKTWEVKDIFDCGSIVQTIAVGQTAGFAACRVKPNAKRGCYSYAVFINGSEAADPEIEIWN